MTIYDRILHYAIVLVLIVENVVVAVVVDVNVDVDVDVDVVVAVVVVLLMMMMLLLLRFLDNIANRFYSIESKSAMPFNDILEKLTTGMGGAYKSGNMIRNKMWPHCYWCCCCCCWW